MAVDADRVYLGYLTGTTNVRTITAFNRYNGARVWSKAATIAAAPAVANGVLYVAEGRNGVAAYNAATGAELWRRPGAANSAAPVVANGRLYVGWRAGTDDSTPAPVRPSGCDDLTGVARPSLFGGRASSAATPSRRRARIGTWQRRSKASKDSRPRSVRTSAPAAGSRSPRTR